MPAGSPIAADISVRRVDPSSPFPTPPPVSPTGFGKLVKNVQLKEGRPREMTEYSKLHSGMNAKRRPAPPKAPS